MSKPGPKPIQIDWEQFDKLCAMQCSLRELASYFDCSEDTVERACLRDNKMEFADYFEQKRGKGKIALRRKQFDIAMGGNVTLLIWLGKQYLDQIERTQIRLDKIPNEVLVEEAQRRLIESKPENNT